MYTGNSRDARCVGNTNSRSDVKTERTSKAAGTSTAEGTSIADVMSTAEGTTTAEVTSTAEGTSTAVGTPAKAEILATARIPWILTTAGPTAAQERYGSSGTADNSRKYQ